MFSIQYMVKYNEIYHYLPLIMNNIIECILGKNDNFQALFQNFLRFVRLDQIILKMYY